MATTSLQPDIAPETSAPVLTPWRISSERYIRMIRDGVFRAGDRVELINGTIVEMAPADSDHHYDIMRLNELIAPPITVARRWIQGTVNIGEDQVFDPDFVLLQPQGDYKKLHPQAADILLVVEVAKSSLAKDRGAKLEAYARAGIADYWIADVRRERLLVHREPQGDRYKKVTELGGDDRITPLLLDGVPGVTVRVGDLFD